MEHTIRRVACTLAQAYALQAVERDSLGDSAYTPERLLQILQRPEHYAYLAYAEEQAVGFCSCLETSADSGPRLEIDMLGVLPEHRRRGLAVRLMREATHEAELRGTRLFRGVVATDNNSSQKAFERAGFRRSAQHCHMLIYEGDSDRELSDGWQLSVEQEGVFWSPEGERAFYAGGAGREVLRLMEGREVLALSEYLAVQTLSYSGLWLEKLWTASEEALRGLAQAIGARRAALGLDEVGYLIPGTPPYRQVLHTFLQAGYQRWGDYWIYGAGVK